MSKEITVKVITESLEKVISGLQEIQVQLHNLIISEDLVSQDKKEVSNEQEKPEKVTKEESIEEERDYFSIEEIEAMKYNELKAYASELGLSAMGKKAEILERILDKLYPDNEEEIEEDEEPENEDEDLEDTKYDKIAEMLEGCTEEELADLLEQIGKSPKGKRQALVSKIVDAIDEGLIEFEDDGEESEEEESDGEVEESEKESEEDEEDEEAIFKNVTEVRKDAIVELRKSIESMYKDGEIKDKEMKEFLEEYHEHLESDCTECNCPNEDRLDCYIKIQTSLIDDEGVQHDLGEPYIVNDNYYCCGRELSELKDETLYCEVCGQEYELE